MPELRLHNSLTRRQGAVRAARSAACADVRVRPDGLRPGAYRQRAPGGGVRRAGAAAAAAVSARHLRAQHHRRGRQDQRARARRAASRSPRSPRAPRRISTPTWRRSARCRRTWSRARPRISREMIAIIERLIASGHAYAAEGHVLFSVPSYPGYGTSVGPQPGRAAGRRARRRGAVQARSRRFRAVEAVDARPAGLGQPLGPRPAGLAHRVQRDVVALSRRDASTSTAAAPT